MFQKFPLLILDVHRWWIIFPSDTKVSISCDTFKVNRGDRLNIGSRRYDGHSFKTLEFNHTGPLGLSFISNAGKTSKGISCSVSSERFPSENPLDTNLKQVPDTGRRCNCGIENRPRKSRINFNRIVGGQDAEVFWHFNWKDFFAFVWRFSLVWSVKIKNFH